MKWRRSAYGDYDLIECRRAYGDYELITRRQGLFHWCKKMISGLLHFGAFLIAIMSTMFIMNIIRHEIGLLIGIGLIVLFFGFMDRHVGRLCPKCGSFAALLFTGNRPTVGSGFGVENVKEYGCRYCDFRYWEEQPEGGG